MEEISLYFDADPDQREKQIAAFQTSHDEWENCKRLIRLHETSLPRRTGFSFTVADAEQLLGEKIDKIDDGSKSLTLEGLARSLFQPGMKFVGTICIPSLGDVLGSAHHHDSDSDSDEGDIFEPYETRNANGDSAQSAGNSGGSAATDSDAQQEARDGSDSISSNTTAVERYELVILEKGKDEFGNDFIMGAHTAYQDTQCVYVNFNVRDADGQQVLDIEYEDEETCIKGTWNPSSCCFSGVVRQRLVANDGAFHTSNEVTHVFTLHPCTYECPNGRGLPNDSPQSSFQEDLLSAETRAYVALRDRANSKGFESVENYNNLFKSDGLKIEFEDFQTLSRKRTLSIFDNVQVRSIWKLRESDWEDLSNCCSMLSEITCAKFRYRTSLLDEASFESGEKKRAFFEKWKRVGFCLAKANAEWDSCNSSAAQLYWFAVVLWGRFQVDSSSLSSMMYKSRRLYQNYNHLETSWRRANARMPTDFLTRYEVSSQEVSHQFTCSICFDGANDGDSTIALYRLPCSHCFHGSCLKQWFHKSHATCPICRSPVTDEKCKEKTQV